MPVLRLIMSVCRRLYGMYCGYMVRPEQKSLLTVVYEKLIGNKMNKLDLCFEVVSRSCEPLHYIQR